MVTSADIKKRAKALAGKTNVESIRPTEVGNLMYDSVEYAEEVERNGGTLGVRKVYTSVAIMQADSVAPVDLWGNKLKRGNLVVIYDGTGTGVDNNKVYAFLKPGWKQVTRVDAGYASRRELSEYNVSVQHPASGVEGTNKYTLAGAIAFVPQELRQNVGIKCSFLGFEGKMETWEYQGGTFANAGNWVQQVRRSEVSELTNLFSGINFNRGALFDRNLKEGLTSLKKIASNKIIAPLFEQGTLRFDTLIPATNRVRSSVLIEIAKAPLIFQLSSGFEIGVFEYDNNGIFNSFRNYLSSGQYNPQSELVRFIMRKSDDGNITPDEANEAIQINGSLIEYSSPPTTEQVNAIYGNLIVDLVKNTGSINAINGKIEPTHTNNFYNRINVTGFIKINSQVFKTGSTYGSAFFDENDNYISGIYFIDVATGDRKEYDVPANASYMLFSYIDDNYAKDNCYPLFDYIEYTKVADTKNTTLTKNVGAVNAVNGQISDTFTNNFYCKINIRGITKVNSQVFKTGSTYGSAFFDKNDTYISGVHFTDVATGDRKEYYVPVDASYMLFSYMDDDYAAANGLPLFDYIRLIAASNTPRYTLSELNKRITFLEEDTGIIYRLRPSSGVESFTVKVNGNIALLDTDVQKGDSYIEMTDYGIIQLPTNYLQNGKPVPLAVVCHGAGASLSQYRTPVVTAGKAMGDPAKFLVQKGYACFDMFANPTQWSGSTSELHYGAPLVLQCYKKGYEYVLKNYNVEKTALYVSGSSMGGIASFQIVQSGCFPVKVHAGFCPVIDVFKQAYCNPWTDAIYQRKKIAEYFRFNDWQNYDGTYNVDYFKANMDKLIGYYPIIKNLVTGDYMRLFEVIPSNSKVQTDNSEENSYSQFTSLHPVPVKIWHNWNDTTVTCRYSKYWIDMIRRSGQIAFFRPFNSGGHNAWDNGEVVNETDISGNAITTHVSEYECWLWFERFRI